MLHKNRSLSAQDIISRRHASLDPPTPRKGSPRAPPPRTVMWPVLKTIIITIVVFAAGITVGTIAHLEHYLHHQHHASATLHQGSSLDSSLPGRIIKRTQQVWAMHQVETIQDSNLQQHLTHAAVASHAAPNDTHSPAPSTLQSASLLSQSSIAHAAHPSTTTAAASVATPHQQLHQQQAAAAAATAAQHPFVQAAAKAHGNELPPDFDWHLYLSYYPDLIAAGINDEVRAKGHYLMIGRREGRLYKPLAITLRYTACGGLTNQHYSHIAAIALGVVLRASVIVPPALSRNSFASYFSQDPHRNQVRWSATPASSMWDIPFLQAYWKARGIHIREGPHDIRLPDLSRPESAYATWLPAGYTHAQVAHVEGVYLRAQDMGRLAATALQKLVLKAQALPDPSTPLLLDLPCSLFMLDTHSAPHLVPEVARSLRFARHMHQLADRVLAGMGTPTPVFNGLHLRMEADATDWANILGGREKLFEMYMQACRQAGFTPDTGMYLASGIFTYGNHSRKQTEVAQSLAAVSGRLFYKEMYLQQSETQGLTKEQTALIDFLVLAKARSFVGISVSTFSFFLKEYRAINGLPKSTSTLVDGSRIGTERLFYNAARVIEI